jgi:hypothetical protein
MSTAISVTKEFLDQILQRGIEKGYQEGLAAGKQESSKDTRRLVVEAHELGVANGLLWGLNCPNQFRLHWEKTGKLLMSMPSSVTTLKTATSHISNLGIYDLVEADPTRHCTTQNLSESDLPAHHLPPTSPISVNAVNIAQPENIPSSPPQSPHFQWSEEPMDTSPPLQPRDFSSLRPDPKTKSSAWTSLQRRKCRRPGRSLPKPQVIKVPASHLSCKLPKVGPGTWLFIPSALRSVILQGDEDAAVLCGG